MALMEVQSLRDRSCECRIKDLSRTLISLHNTKVDFFCFQRHPGDLLLQIFTRLIKRRNKINELSSINLIFCAWTKPPHKHDRTAVELLKGRGGDTKRSFFHRQTRLTVSRAHTNQYTLASCFSINQRCHGRSRTNHIMHQAQPSAVCYANAARFPNGEKIRVLTPRAWPLDL